MPIINTSRLITIEKYIVQEEDHYPEATGAFTRIMQDLIFSFRLIAREVRRAGLNDILGLTEQYNVHGEQVRKIDKYAHEAIYRSLYKNSHICAMVSEENEDILPIPNGYNKGKYVLAYDPLDGSTNIDCNGVIGTIFSILKRRDTNSETSGNESDLLQEGFKQVAAGYIIYGSSTVFAYTTGNGVNVFTYDPTIGEFLLTIENIIMPKKGNQYSCNESNYNRWDIWVRKYIDHIKLSNVDGKQYTSRYYATAVADIHRIIHYGGIYLYPAQPDKPEGKIRLLYEANPLSLIIEQAGGRAITGPHRILDIKPNYIHQTIPFFVGSQENVTELEEFYKKYT